MAEQKYSKLHPLTSPQREIWFDQILHEDIPLYNIGGYVKIPCVMDPVLFERAINLLVQKHDTLRTVLTEKTDEDGVPMQTYAEKLVVTVPLQDFSTKANPHESAMKWMQQRFIESFELTGQPLFRYDLVKISDDYYYWLMQYHHLIVDGYAIALLNRSLAEIYTQLANGQIPNLNSLSYTAFIDNDRAYIESAVFDKQRQYWLSKYPVPPEPLFNPRYRSQYTDKLIGSGCEVLYLPRDFYNRLNELAKQHNATLFHLLLGALYVYFTRIAGRDDFAIGLPVLNRANANFKKTAGLFTGVSPTLFNFGKDLSFAELLLKINKTLKANYRHQRFPISEINRSIGLEQPNPQLFDISLAYLNHDHDALFNEAHGHTIQLFNEYEQNPLLISVEDFHSQQDIKFDFVFNLAYFNIDDIKALQARFVTILEAVLKDSVSLIHTLPIMTEQEIKQLQAWNNTATDYPKDKTIVDLFEQQVEKTPSNIAVVFEEQQLSYQQLNEKANQLAHHLLALGIKQNNPLIAIAVERSLEMVIGLLGILKAGGAYVPIDPSYPSARIRYMLDDSACPLLLTQSHLKAQLESDCVVLCLDEVDFADQSSENPAIRFQMDELAYVIYTSGSTGKPKGVMIEHSALSNFIHSSINVYVLTSHDKVLQFASISFDTAAEEIYPTLLKGAALILRTEGILSTTEAFLTTCNEQKLTVLDLPTAYWHSLLTDIHIIKKYWPTSVRLVLIGGEAVSSERIRQWLENFEYFPILLNTYGPTETTVVATVFPFPTINEIFTVSIGQPIANTRIYILDIQNQPQPPNIPGELCIAGAGLARGYLNRPELTAEKFIEVELFGKTERIYKTGDLARWLPDGNLEYLGRIDNQVKLRGFRIELGEIEAVLSQHEVVKEAVVTLYEADDNKRLVAYLTTDAESNVELIELKDWLKERLPDYMIPSHFTVLNKLPLTPNGKIDRKALPAPKIEIITGIKPQTPTEELLAGLWINVLKCEAINRNDNFFELGGHSLLATQLIARIRDSFQVELPVKLIFQHPILCELAEQINQSQASNLDAPQSSFIKITKLDIPTDTTLPISLTELELWFMEQLYPHAADMYYLPLNFRFVGPLNVARLEKSLMLMAQSHEVLRNGFIREGDKVIRVIPEIFTLPFENIDLRKIPTTEREAAARQQLVNRLTRPLNLAQGPLWHCVLWHINEDEYWFLFVIHHIISDGWSIGVIAQEIAQHYRTLAEGLPITPIEAVFEYKQFAAWQWRYFNSEKALQDRNYWCTVLKEPPPPLIFPDSPRPTERKFIGDAYPVKLAPALLAKLYQLSQQTESTLFITLLTAFKLLLFAYTQHHDLIVGTPFANRTQTEFENEIGFFVNTLPIRTDLSGNPSAHELLLRVMESTMGVITHQQTPFIKVLEWAQPQKATGHAQLHQILFALQNTPEIHMFFSEKIKVSELSLPQTDHAVEFDLFMSLEETPDGIIGGLLYRKDLFSQAWIANFCEDYQNILQRLVAMFDEPIETLLKDIGTKTEIPQTAQDIKITSTSMNQPDLTLTETEQFLMAMWQDILDTTVLSIYDDFFEIGGSSLQLLMLLNQIEHTFSCNIIVYSLFENTTIHQQSQLIVSSK